MANDRGWGDKTRDREPARDAQGRVSQDHKLQPGNTWAPCLCAEIDPSDVPCIVCECRFGTNDPPVPRTAERDGARAHGRSTANTLRDVTHERDAALAEVAKLRAEIAKLRVNPPSNYDRGQSPIAIGTGDPLEQDPFAASEVKIR